MAPVGALFASERRGPHVEYAADRAGACRSGLPAGRQVRIYGALMQCEEPSMDASGDDRREHRRHDLKCPITVFGRGGEVLTKAETTNISGGGTYLTVPMEVLSKVQRGVNVAFSVSGSSGRARSLEGFAANARVVRHEPMADDKLVGVALAFTREIELGLSE